MAGDVITATGAKFYFGPQVPSTIDTESEFSALAFTEVSLVESLGEFGDQSSAVNFAALSDGRQRKAKGVRDAGEMPVVCGKVAGDPGQQALIDAEATNFKYAVKIVLPDAQSPGGTGTTLYFRVLVMSKRLNIGSSDNIIRNSFNLGIDSAIIEVAPT